MFKQIIDDRGLLSIFEFSDIPFIPKRVFVRQNMIPESNSGNGHFHGILEEYIYVLSGNCTIITENVLTREKITIEGKAGTNLLIPPLTKTNIISHSIDTSMLVLCSEEYDPKDVFYD